MASKVSSTVKETRARVTQEFTENLYQHRDEELEAFVKQRQLSQHTANIDTADSTAMYELVQPHTESMNWMLEEGLDLAISNLPEIHIRPTPDFPDIPQIKFKITKVQIQKPCYGGSSEPLYPHEARELGITYDAPFYITVERQVGEGVPEVYNYPASQ
eukprot:UN07219